MKKGFIPSSFVISKAGQVVIDAARAGGRAILSSSFETRATKLGKFDIVTQADKRSNDAIIRVIKKSLPKAQILSEELVPASDLDTGGSLFLIDPLDGTLNAHLGLNHFSVSIAYAKNGVVKAAAVFNPLTNDFYFAEKGKGAYKNGERIEVGKTTDLDSALIWTDSVREKKLRQLTVDILNYLNPEFASRGSTALNMSIVASGKVDLYFCKGYTGPWDIAAAILLNTEAKGAVYDLSGNNLTNKLGNYLTRDVVVGNKTLVKKFVKVTKSVVDKFKVKNPEVFGRWKKS